MLPQFNPATTLTLGTKSLPILQMGKQRLSEDRTLPEVMALVKSRLGFEPSKSANKDMVCTSALFYSRIPGKF